MTKISIKFYGTCGSFPVTADDRRVFGGNTSCILFSFGKTKIMLDAGSGANAAMRELGGEKHLDLLISHPHLDHTSGIVSLIPSFGGRELDIYGKTRDGMTVSDICFRLMGKPFWPVSPDLFPGIRFFDVPESFEIGGVKIGTLESNHPGGSTAFRFSYGGKTIVSAIDFNHADGYGEKLAEFAKGCDLLIYDGMMSDEEYKIHSTWGHSTPRVGAEIAKKCGCRLIVTHHSTSASDGELEAAEKKTRALYENSLFAKDNMTVEL